jgi:hypothetical protein
MLNSPLLLEGLSKRKVGGGNLTASFFKLVGLTVVDFTGKERRFLLASLSSEDGGRCFGVLCERAFAWADFVAAIYLHLPVVTLLSSTARAGRSCSERDVVDASDCWSYFRRICPCCFCTCMIMDGVGDVCTLPFRLPPLQVLGAALSGNGMSTTALSGE